MQTRKRLMALKKWMYETVCKGRMMKAPAEDFDYTKIIRQEPQVFLGWPPTRPDEHGGINMEIVNVCPGIIISPTPSNAKFVESKRFDTYKNIHRPQELGQWLNITMLFSVYEPGIRLPGFCDGSRLDVKKIMEGTEEGLFTLTDWMDDVFNALISQKTIPGSDMTVDEENIIYSLYTEHEYVVDKRPIFYGSINAKFNCYSENGSNSIINNLLI